MRIRYWIHTSLGEHPHLLFKVNAIFNIHPEYSVNENSSLVIDAFPRSGSTFALYAFLFAHKEQSLSVAYHLHVPAHIMRACQLNIPALVIIRHPKDAVSSAVVREPHLAVKAYLLRYRSFYQTLQSYREQFVLAEFNEVINQFDTVINKVNEKYGTTFTPFEYTQENLEQVQHQMNLRHKQTGGDELTSYLPNARKNIAKTAVDFSDNEALLEECETIYQSYLDGTIAH
jgi:hypothetical protein